MILWLVLVGLGGCSTVASAVHPIIKKTPITMWSVDVESPGKPYAATWRTQLAASDGGDGPGRANPPAAAPIHAENWVVQLHGVGMQADGDARAAMPAWNDSVQRLYVLTRYLLAAPPLPLDVQGWAESPQKDYSHEWRTRDADAIPMRYAFQLSAPDGDNSAERFRQQREALMAIGYQLQHFELARGVTAAPSDPVARRVKDEANSLCWTLAVRPALGAGYDVRLKGAGQVPINATVNVFGIIYEKHPDSRKALMIYAAGLLFRNAQAYLDHVGVSWPDKGTDTKGIRTMLRFCRAFVHYPGDIRTELMPVTRADAQPEPPVLTVRQ